MYAPQPPTPEDILAFGRAAFPDQITAAYAPMHAEIVAWALGLAGPPAEVAVLAIPRAHGASWLLSRVLPLCVAVTRPGARVGVVLPNEGERHDTQVALARVAAGNPTWGEALRRVLVVGPRDPGRRPFRGQRLEYVGVDAPGLHAAAHEYVRLPDRWEMLDLLLPDLRPGGRIAVYGSLERPGGVLARLLAPGPQEPGSAPRLARRVWSAEGADGAPAWPGHLDARLLGYWRAMMGDEQYALNFLNLPDAAVLAEHERERREVARLVPLLEQTRGQWSLITGEAVEYVGGGR